MINVLSAAVVAFPFVVVAWLISNTTRTKSGRPGPHVPADVDLGQAVATTKAITDRGPQQYRAARARGFARSRA